MPEKLRDLIAVAEKKLRKSGVGNPRLDAEILIAFVLGCGREKILSDPELEIPDPDALRFRELVERRAVRYPLQYLTNRQEFYSLEFYVDERVLIPRHESELIVDEVLKLNRKESPVIADIGTGSGNLAVTVAVRIRKADIIATDSSVAALEVAKMNADRHAVSGRIRFLEGDFLQPLKENFPNSSFDFIISNPPYVCESEMGILQDEVRVHEPHGALLSGEGGLVSYGRIILSSFDLLGEGGCLILELGAGRAESVGEILLKVPFSRIYFQKDMQGIDRIAAAIK